MRKTKPPLGRDRAGGTTNPGAPHTIRSSAENHRPQRRRAQSLPAPGGSRSSPSRQRRPHRAATVPRSDARPDQPNRHYPFARPARGNRTGDRRFGPSMRWNTPSVSTGNLGGSDWAFWREPRPPRKLGRNRRRAGSTAGCFPLTEPHPHFATAMQGIGSWGDAACTTRLNAAHAVFGILLGDEARDSPHPSCSLDLPRLLYEFLC